MLEVARPYRTMDVSTLLATPFPPREQLLAPWLPAKGLAMVYGPRGIGKTHLTLGIAYAVASGGSFLGWQAPRPRRVLVVDGEMPAVALQERMAAIVAAAPDILLVTTTGLESVGGVDGLLAIPGIDQTPAAANRQVVAFEDQYLYGLGPRTGHLVGELVDAFHPAP